VSGITVSVANIEKGTQADLHSTLSSVSPGNLRTPVIKIDSAYGKELAPSIRRVKRCLRINVASWDLIRDKSTLTEAHDAPEITPWQRLGTICSKEDASEKAPIPVEKLAALQCPNRLQPFSGEISGNPSKQGGRASSAKTLSHPTQRQRFAIEHEDRPLLLHTDGNLQVDKTFLSACEWNLRQAGR